MEGPMYNVHTHRETNSFVKKRWVHRECKCGALSQLGAWGWSEWKGRING